MIGRTTKIQLVVFAAITLLGVSYVGATHAQLDRMVIDRTYTVTANFADSGGIFTGAEVTYRGVGVGRVGEMQLSRDGVFVDMEIEKDADPIPRDVVAQVANRSAVGEQYIELQPKRQGEPYLEDGTDIPRADTATPISITTMLTNLDQLVNSIGKRDLRVVVDELGAAFQGTGQDLAQIIDTSTSYIETADEHFDVTVQLIEDSRTVLQTQVDLRSAIETYATNLARFSDTLVAKDRQIRRVIDSGSAAATEVRDFIEENGDQLGELISNMLTQGEITVARLHGLEQYLVLFPYVVEGGYGVVAKDPIDDLYRGNFGIILTEEPPVCTDGYETTRRNWRRPSDRREIPFDTALHCAEPPGQSNPRGAQHHPAPLNRVPVVANYDPTTGEVQAADEDPMADHYTTGDEAQLFGKESWKWLLLGPAMTDQ